jgi:hypothetical protein
MLAAEKRLEERAIVARERIERAHRSAIGAGGSRGQGIERANGGRGVIDVSQGVEVASVALCGKFRFCGLQILAKKRARPAAAGGTKASRLRSSAGFFPCRTASRSSRAVLLALSGVRVPCGPIVTRRVLPFARYWIRYDRRPEGKMRRPNPGSDSSQRKASYDGCLKLSARGRLLHGRRTSVRHSPLGSHGSNQTGR